MLPRLQYISQGKTPDEHLENIRCVLDAGVRCIQLRLKNTDERTYSETARMAKLLCSEYDAELVINDSPFVAKSVEADAVHLGLSDMVIEEARKILPGKIVGGTANTYVDVKNRYSEKADYIGLGPYRFTKTKEKLSPVLGLEGYQHIIDKMREDDIAIPVYAIGGIMMDDIGPLIKAGVYGVAISGLLTKTSEPKKLVQEIHKILNDA